MAVLRRSSVHWLRRKAEADAAMWEDVANEYKAEVERWRESSDRWRDQLKENAAEVERLQEDRDEWKFRAERAEAEAELFNQRIELHHREEKQAKARLTEFEVGDDG